MRQWIESALVQIMACRLFGANLNLCLVKWTPGNKFQWNLNRNYINFIRKMHLKISSAKMAAILSRGRRVRPLAYLNAICLWFPHVWHIYRVVQLHLPPWVIVVAIGMWIGNISLVYVIHGKTGFHWPKCTALTSWAEQGIVLAICKMIKFVFAANNVFENTCGFSGGALPVHVQLCGRRT